MLEKDLKIDRFVKSCMNNTYSMWSKRKQWMVCKMPRKS